MKGIELWRYDNIYQFRENMYWSDDKVEGGGGGGVVVVFVRTLSKLFFYLSFYFSLENVFLSLRSGNFFF